MKTYLAHIRTTLKLTMRERSVLFFNYLLPLLFFVVFAQSFGADRGGAISQVITMVLIMGVLGSGFFGAGLRAVQERELNILRRFKVAPITPLPILVSSLVTGVIAYLPSLAMVLLIARFYYGMPFPPRLLSLVALLTLGLVAFRSVGLTIAAVANSMQESQIIIQLMYLPMLFLSGATFPVSMLPDWLQVAAQFLPATYLYTGLNGILVRQETLAQNWVPVLGMLATTGVALLLGVKLFRWEKEEKLPGKAKLWLAAVMLPFLAMGVWQSYKQENIAKAKVLYRDMRRNRAMLIRGARIVVGDGKVIPAGAVLLRDGKIAQVFESVPAEDSVKAEVMEAAGKTVLPGLVDAAVHLSLPGGVPADKKQIEPFQMVERELAAHLYCGVVAVRSEADPQSLVRRVGLRIAGGEKLGAELLDPGKIFTAEGGPEYFQSLPEPARRMAEQDTVFAPKSVEEARQQVSDWKAGAVSVLFDPRMDEAVFDAIAAQARKQGLALRVRTRTVAAMEHAVAAGAAVIEVGALEPIPDELFARMAKAKVRFVPALTAAEASEGRVELLDRTLVQQVAPEGLVAATKAAVSEPKEPGRLAKASDNVARAWKAGVELVAGTDSGSFLLVHGPALHRELQLWVAAGVPADAAVRAATAGTARVLGLGDRVGLVKPGYDASLLVVDGDPGAEIAATERISSVFFRGERVNRAELFE